MRHPIVQLTLAALLSSATAAIAQEEVEITQDGVKVRDKNGKVVEVRGANVTVQGDDDDDDDDSAPSMIITGNHKKVKQVCLPGKANFTVSGNKNEVALTGDCDTVTVTGNANVVSMERVKSLVMTGNKNRATYIGGVGGADPKITHTGNQNVVKRVPAKP